MVQRVCLLDSFKDRAFSRFACFAKFAFILIVWISNSAVADTQKSFGCLGSAIENITPPAKIKAQTKIDWSRLSAGVPDNLPSAFSESLRKHPTVTELKEKFGDGARLHIEISDFDELFDGNGHRRFPSTGEMVQKTFLEKIVKAIFPKAVITDELPGTKSKLPDRDHKISLWVTDSAESGYKIDWRTAGDPHAAGGRTIEMSFLKAANPGPAVKTRKQLRKTMGLPEGKRVVSLYVSSRAGTGSVQRVIDRILASNTADVIIVSNGYINDMKDLAAWLTQKSGVQTVRSGSLNKEPVSGNRKAFIINESRGQMPFVHAASDLTVVVGSPNLFESLNVGTPTLFFKKAEGAYDTDAWKMQCELAKQTGGGIEVETMEGLSAALRGPITKPKIPVASLRDVDGTTALDRLLSNIKNALLLNGF